MNPKAPRMNLVAAPRVGRGKSVAQKRGPAEELTIDVYGF
jgi:hypothetical protein